LHTQICDAPAGSFDALLWQLELARDYCDNPYLTRSILEDAVRFVPELAPFAAPALADQADERV